MKYKKHSLFSLEEIKVKEQLSAKRGGNTVLTSVFKTSVLCALEGLVQGGQTFPVKGQTVNTLSFAGHTFSVTTPQLCCCSMKAPQTTCKKMSVAVFQ